MNIGHYEIGEKLGEGGMGVVYRARDSKLGREVAFKVLPPALADDPERLARLQREAQVLASLNHPNIAHIYGIEGSALVMEYVPGETLHGPVPVDEAMAIAKQIADALEAAHEKGIIHRDLKPANVKLTPDGKVKVLDFGLAKAFSDDPSGSSIANSPTLSLAATRAGTILGTAAYMSPEQARGKAVDRRTDIWAFGCVLFELLTGKQAFGGETVTDTMAAIVKSDPDWSLLPPGSPVELLRLCLQKDPKLRLRDIGDSALITTPAASVPQSAIRNPQSAIAWVLAGVMAVVAVALTLRFVVFPPPPAPRSVQRFTIPLAPITQVYGFAMSADGRRLGVAGAVGSAQSRIYVRPLDRNEFSILAGTEAAEEIFFSPDGEWIGFVASGKLKKIPTSGGAAAVLTDSMGNGADWGTEDIVATNYTLGGQAAILARVSPAGGDARSLGISRDDAAYQIWPSFLPGGRDLLFSGLKVMVGGTTNGSVMVARLNGTKPVTRTLTSGMTPRYVPTGHILFVRGQDLMALPFDLKTLQATGSPFPMVEGVSVRALNGQAHYSVSRDGTLVYWAGAIQDARSHIVWVDRTGKAEMISAPPHSYWDPRVSPDGKRVAALVREAESEIWVFETTRGTLTRMTFDPAEDETPVWSPDGQWLAYSSTRSGKRQVLRRRSDGSGAEEVLWTSEQHVHMQSWSPDGRFLLLTARHPDSSDDIWVIEFDAGGKATARPLLRSRFRETQARVSPDGKWLAYVSDESGRPEIYVQPFPSLGGKWQVSAQGGYQPVWGPGGRELFYRSGKEMMAVSVTPGSAFTPSQPRALFADSYTEPQDFDHYYYDLSPDGRRFLMVKPVDRPQAPVQLNVVLNWFEELKGKGK